MISRFRIQRFKCFADQTIQFGNLTLLAGGNATGKSTVIQALLLLRQAYLRGSLTKGEMPLNGSLVSIGTIRDAFYSNSEIDSIAFSLNSSEGSTDIVCGFAVERGELGGYILSGDPVTNSSLNLFEPLFTYLNTERTGPRLLYPMTELPREEMQVGIHGEYTAHCLAEFGEEAIGSAALAYPGADIQSDRPDYLALRHQTQLWMRSIVPDLEIETNRINEADTVRLGLKNRSSTSDFFLRPTNMGFGVSYTLPIVVAALMAKPNSMLIIENPEAHLHPSGQSEIGQFLARAAATGVQVIVETHSDHILNGIRLAVRRNILQAESVSIQFFVRGSKGDENQILAPKIDSDGRIDSWPPGFFDQMEKDLLELF